MAAAARALAAVLLACAASGAGAQAPAQPPDLGALFHSPEERERLDRLRRGETPEKAAVAGPTRTPEVTGFVKRSDGRHTVWINGIAVPVASPKADAVLDPQGVRAYADREASELKVERRERR